MVTKRGSDTAWRQVRQRVLARDNGECQIKGPDCKHYATQVHHTLGLYTGNDPRYLVAACKPCNQSAGDPTRHGKSPAPNPPRTRW